MLAISDNFAQFYHNNLSLSIICLATSLIGNFEEYVLPSTSQQTPLRVMDGGIISWCTLEVAGCKFKVIGLEIFLIYLSLLSINWK